MGIDFWTEDKIGDLRKLFAMKYSAGEIAEKIGAPSRNAVCGKLARLGLTRGLAVRHARPATIVKRVRKPSHAAGVGAQVQAINRGPIIAAKPFVCADAADIVPLNVTFHDLQDGDCRYPFDAPHGSSISHVFCGHPALEGRPYCIAHAKIATVPTPPRKNVVPTAYGQSKGGVFGRVA